MIGASSNVQTKRSAEDGVETHAAKRSRLKGAAASIGRPRDAPEGHVAHKEVKRNGEAYVFDYEYADGTKRCFRASMKECNGNQDECARVARLMYMKVEAGATFEEVKDYRRDLFSMCGDVSAVIERLREAGRLKGAFAIRGRCLKAKNSSINGVYIETENGLMGHSAYHKVVGGLRLPHRFLFFSSRKNCWKISDSLDDAKGGFAYARASDNGQRSPADPKTSLRWHVYEGKDKGFVEDTKVRCHGFLRKRSRTDTKACVSGEDDISELLLSSDGSCGSDTSQESDEPKATTAASEIVTETRPAKIVPNGRVCAKMPVLGNFRCSCHFVHLALCPLRRLSMSCKSRGLVPHA
eukprot:TRINITY_DN66732_c0_g1_i1.p1 TRINITY_DN66732_c0_g1~~TRINITY_DN66732_c0_g1_i1.p1  ORF type:complete len:353 (-),score=42.40 TRINITY_DN66732_c0_g1_i1:139-1197(-)